MGLRVLLTGGTGYLGSSLLRALVGRGDSVVLLKRSFSNVARIADLLPMVTSFDTDRVPLEAAFQQHPIDLVVNCATDYGRKSGEPLQILDANLAFPLALLSLCKRHGVPRFVNTDTILDKRVSHYSLSKKQFLDWFKLASAELACVNVALEHFYGPGDDKTKFVSAMISLLLQGVPGIDLTPGEQKRDFIHISDVVAAFLLIIDHSRSLDRGFHGFEVGTGQPIPIRQILGLVKEIAGNQTTELRFGALPYRDNEVMESRVNLESLRRLGWEPRTDLGAGLTQTIQLERQRLTT